jgi:membrane-associated phospholipid phosphatase
VPATAGLRSREYAARGAVAGARREGTVTGTRAARRATRLWALRDRAVALDKAIASAVDETETPTLDRFLVRLSESANNSRLWLAIAAVVAVAGGRRGRRGAADAIASIGLASALSNVGVKSLAPRLRPMTAAAQKVASRRVRIPVTPSFPSGHAASAFAFASTMGEALPVTWVPLHATAGLVAYSRIHTGVHYPSDVAVGALLGTLCGWTVRRLAAAWRLGRR